MHRIANSKLRIANWRNPCDFSLLEKAHESCCVGRSTTRLLRPRWQGCRFASSQAPCQSYRESTRAMWHRTGIALRGGLWCGESGGFHTQAPPVAQRTARIRLLDPTYRSSRLASEDAPHDAAG